MKVKKMVIAIVLSSTLVISSVCGVKYLYDVKNYKKEVASIEIKDIDMTKVKDGQYIGKYDVNFIAAKVKVTVKDHKIQDINLLEHKNERGKAAEAIVDTVIAKNSIKVDTISGATNSSKVILEAIRNALEG
ncbi:FMN-binding protein [Anaeromicropila herbilytica]|uniref:FMN-binding protein n=1 Tax=Anaeromicropila herbilytica TaxID=2785025 RepID=A0A7R7EJM1_9FIRM|nr:FMN-binding protein [Anaeromicropila herbilytica]BCN29900.1 FMN-binding protein [Anaeromicropila herbilytica]